MHNFVDFFSVDGVLRIGNVISFLESVLFFPVSCGAVEIIEVMLFIIIDTLIR